jgi:SAM-dependent methyltransferase
VNEPAALSAFPDAPDVESSSVDYQRRFAGAVGAWFVGVQCRALLAALPATPRPLRVLDVGGGHGQNIAALLGAGAEVTVLASPDAPTEVIAPLLPRIHYQRGNLNQIPFPDRSFDVVVCFRILAHIDDWQRHVSELTRVAQQRVICDYPVRRSVNALAEGLFAMKKQIESNTRRFRVFREAELVAAFRRHGAETAYRHGQFVLPMAVHRALKSARLSAALEAGCGLVGLDHLLGSPVIAAFALEKHR